MVNYRTRDQMDRYQSNNYLPDKILLVYVSLAIEVVRSFLVVIGQPFHWNILYLTIVKSGCNYGDKTLNTKIIKPLFSFLYSWYTIFVLNPATSISLFAGQIFLKLAKFTPNNILKHIYSRIFFQFRPLFIQKMDVTCRWHWVQVQLQSLFRNLS